MKVRFALISLFLLTTPHLFAQKFTGYADLVAKVQDGVVSIRVVREAQTNSMEEDMFERFFNRSPRRQPRESQGGGTGFVISKDGYIVTNRHVVKDATEITVVKDEEEMAAELIGVDDSLDVAVIKVQGSDMSPLTMGDSDKMRIGDAVLALGYPLGIGFSVTTGIVSGLGRNFFQGNMDISEFIQTDADITFGNSGGPLINMSGDVIAINTMIVSQGETYGFSIPSNLFKRSVEQLVKTGTVRRGALGVTIAALSDEDLEFYGVAHGALVTGLTPGLPAEEAGVRRYDVITEINGKEIKDNTHVIQTVSAMFPGDKVKVTLMRKGKKLKKTFALGDRAAFFEETPVAEAPPKEEESVEMEMGFSVTGLDNRMKRRMGLEEGQYGVIVTDVSQESEAAEKGLRPGHIITHVGAEEVSSENDLRKAIESIPNDKLVALDILDPRQDNLEARILVRKK